MPIICNNNINPTATQVISLYNTAGLPRSTDDSIRIQKMYDNSNLIVTAWDGDVLVGVVRCITDWCWNCYLADLSVQVANESKGSGKNLIACYRNKLCSR